MKTEEKYTFFWGGPFSNFATAYFVDAEGISYSCTEQYYMAKKALFFKDNESHYKIMAETNPTLQKKLGRGVKDFDERLWYGSYIEKNPAKQFMFEGNYLKYSQNEKLKKLLLNTAGTTLAEASPYDLIWGVGCRVGDLGAKCKRFWRGKNWLGEVLTQVRDKLLKEEEKKYLF